jgi:glutamyl-tRNA reductase
VNFHVNSLDSELFTYLLSYFRSGEFFVDEPIPNILLKRISTEAQFFQVDDLQKIIQTIVEERSNIQYDFKTIYSYQLPEYLTKPGEIVVEK